MTSEAQKRAIQKWRLAHRESYNAYQREKRKKNPERYKQYQINYWKRKLGLTEVENHESNE